jgi:HK97 family phage portal protein
MTLSEMIKKAFKLGTPRTGNMLEFTEMQVPPSWGYQSYLQAYGQVGWLFACVNVIANAVARQSWHLYELESGERNEIFEHELLDLLNHINPFQSMYQFIYLSTMYKKLVGESFWQMNFNGAGKPAEMWLAPPSYMSVIPSADKYISHYEFKRTGMSQPIKFSIDEIIHIMTPNPYNPYRGLSEAQALTSVIDSERSAATLQNKLFYNDGRPGFVIEYPAQDMPPVETRKELVMEWDERYKGIRNAGKTAFLWGGKANTVTLSPRDLDFANLRNFSRDAILGAYAMPKSVLGLTEASTFASAKAGNYTFAFYVVHPELCAIRESMNKELCPFFGDNLYLDFENPIPEDETMQATNAVNLFKGGVVNRNEARIMVDLDPLETPDGEEFFVQPSPLGFPNEKPPESPMDESPADESPVKSIKKAISRERKELYWKEYVSRAESYEPQTIGDLRQMYLNQKQDALTKLQDAKDAKAKLLDLKKAKKDYTALMNPILKSVMAGAIKNGQQLLEPENPHKVLELPVDLSSLVLRWLRSRIGWAAEQTNEETASLLSYELSEGFEKGESITLISQRIERVFDNASAYRAERIARTEILQASAQGAIEGYRQSGVKKLEFYPALDDRLCEDCLALSESDLFGYGKAIFPISETEGVITVHPNCRCVFLPVIET